MVNFVDFLALLGFLEEYKLYLCSKNIVLYLFINRKLIITILGNLSSNINSALITFAGCFLYNQSLPFPPILIF